ncbi:MAG: hypothetical protein PHE56_03525 [Bacteroidales bacterium]|nr:hypothetical protein [Bacteroidales bacterium]
MSFIEFRSQLFNLVCFNTNQVYAFDPSFDKNNLTNWVKKGYILKLRQGYYTFPEYLGESGFSFYLANKIYRPSYISLHSALSFYGLIPESVSTITSVSTIKTVEFENNFGRFLYNSVKESAYFGFVIKTTANGRNFYIAEPEKALLDLLYLYPFYKKETDFIDLRFDFDFLHDELDIEKLQLYSQKFGIIQLEKRVGKFLKAYEL